MNSTALTGLNVSTTLRQSDFFVVVSVVICFVNLCQGKKGIDLNQSTPSGATALMLCAQVYKQKKMF